MKGVKLTPRLKKLPSKILAFLWLTFVLNGDSE